MTWTNECSPICSDILKSVMTGLFGTTHPPRFTNWSKVSLILTNSPTTPFIVIAKKTKFHHFHIMVVTHSGEVSKRLNFVWQGMTQLYNLCHFYWALCLY